MAQKRILAFSSSREGNSGYLESAAPLISDLLGDNKLNIAFIPFAAVNIDYDAYTEKVVSALSHLPYAIQTVYPKNAFSIIENADVIMIGGGNSFKLLHDIYALKIFDIIQHKVNTGTPYIGWSAGSNLASPGIFTSNDMPIIQPESFKAFSFFPFQINPHYFNVNIPGHNGETRDQRLEEFMLLNKKAKVLGMPEGTALKLDKDHLELIGLSAATLFFYDEDNQLQKKELAPNEEAGILLGYS
ncbi:MAG: dipeptidase PepE [Ferruginibacter sp.]